MRSRARGAAVSPGSLPLRLAARFCVRRLAGAQGRAEARGSGSGGLVRQIVACASLRRRSAYTVRVTSHAACGKLSLARPTPARDYWRVLMAEGEDRSPGSSPGFLSFRA